MKMTRKVIYLISAVIVICSLSGCEDKGKQVDVQGQVKLVLVRGEDFSFTTQLFLVTAPNVYHLTFDSLCAAEGGSDSAQDGDGFPMVIGGKNFLIHSGATYRISGIPHTKGTVLSTRTTTPLLVNRFAYIATGTGTGTGTSYAYLGWDGKSTTWAPPEALAATGILVNDSDMTMKVEGGKFVMGGGGKTVDINSVAAWAREP